MPDKLASLAMATAGPICDQPCRQMKSSLPQGGREARRACCGDRSRVHLAEDCFIHENRESHWFEPQTCSRARLGCSRKARCCLEGRVEAPWDCRIIDRVWDRGFLSREASPDVKTVPPMRVARPRAATGYTYQSTLNGLEIQCLDQLQGIGVLDALGSQSDTQLVGQSPYRS